MGNAFSPSIIVTHGVKQGGIISPNLLNSLHEGTGCFIKSSNNEIRSLNPFLKHLCYTDDLCSIKLSSTGM